MGVKSGKAILTEKGPTAKQLKVRQYTHLYEQGLSRLKCDACGLSESNPIHDFRNPPGIGPI